MIHGSASNASPNVSVTHRRKSISRFVHPSVIDYDRHKRRRYVGKAIGVYHTHKDKRDDLFTVILMRIGVGTHSSPVAIHAIISRTGC